MFRIYKEYDIHTSDLTLQIVEVVERFLLFLYSEDISPDEKYKVLSEYYMPDTIHYILSIGMPFILTKIEEIQSLVSYKSHDVIGKSLKEYLNIILKLAPTFNTLVNEHGEFNYSLNMLHHHVTKTGNNILKRLNETKWIDEVTLEWFHIVYDIENYDGLFVEMGYGLFLLERIPKTDITTKMTFMFNITTLESLSIITDDYRIRDYYLFIYKKLDRARYWHYKTKYKGIVSDISDV